MIYRLRRRYMSLLEVLIAMALTTILLSSLTYMYRQVDWLNTETERIQKENFQMRYLESRLAAILPKVLAESSSKENFYFFTSALGGGGIKSGTASLVFAYDNQVDLATDFANNVIGRLYLDTHKRLCLATWPSPERWLDDFLPPVKKEVLLQNVEALSFMFFIPPDKDRAKVNGSKELKPPKPLKPGDKEAAEEEALALAQALAMPASGVKGLWINEWNRDYGQLPALVKIHVLTGIGEEKKELVFAFALPNCKKVIVYEQ